MTPDKYTPKCPPLKFEETHSSNSGEITIHASYKMKCQCIISHKCTREVAPADERSKEHMRNMLRYWFEQALPWHSCALVGALTPSGIIPHKDRTSAIGPHAGLLDVVQV